MATLSFWGDRNGGDMAYTAEQLCDLEAIRDAAKRYSHGLDRLDPECMRSAYWPDGYDDHGDEWRGNAWGYVDVAMESHRNWAPSLHTILNHLIDLHPDGTHASGEIYVIAYLFRADSEVLYTWYGRYLDDYERRGGEWRILKRVVVHEGSRTDDPLPRMPHDMSGFRQGDFDRPSRMRPLGPG